jgi:hypothetical protein
LGVPSGQAVRFLLFYPAGQNNKILPSFTLTNKKNVYYFSQIRNYNKTPSTEIEANN